MPIDTAPTISMPVKFQVAGVISNGTMALTFNQDGSVTCYKIARPKIMQLPTDAMVAYLALCAKPKVRWGN